MKTIRLGNRLALDSMNASSKNDSGRNSPFIHWLPVAALCAAIFVQSCFPTFNSNPGIPYWDKILHAGVYGLLAVLFFRAGRFTWHPRLTDFRLLIVSIVFTGLYGASDELHQSLVAARTADGYDLFADCVGAALGAMLAMAWFHRRGSRSGTSHSNMTVS